MEVLEEYCGTAGQRPKSLVWERPVYVGRGCGEMETI